MRRKGAAFAAAGFAPLLVAGDLNDEKSCRELVAQTLSRVMGGSIAS